MDLTNKLELYIVWKAGLTSEEKSKLATKLGYRDKRYLTTYLQTSDFILPVKESHQLIIRDMYSNDEWIEKLEKAFKIDEKLRVLYENGISSINITNENNKLLQDDDDNNQETITIPRDILEDLNDYIKVSKELNDKSAELISKLTKFITR